MRIGIDQNNHDVYEGESYYGRPLTPAPMLTPATIVFPSDGPPKPPSTNEPSFGEFMFREDSFDPIAGIRRGRFYENLGPQPREWQITRMAPSRNHPTKERLNTYDGNPIGHKYLKGKDEQPLVCLGFDDRFTIWSIINVEATSTREDLVTLKARRGIGILPGLDKEQIPEDHRRVVLESLEGFADEVHRAAPISVIDRARDTITQVLMAYFEASPQRSNELGSLINDLRAEPRKKVVAINAANIIARLHSRGKSNEQRKHDLRPIREQDAELATQCVGTILCELGWAEWA